MIRKLKNRWLRPKMLGVLVAKLILGCATDLAGQTDTWKNVSHPPQRIEMKCSCTGFVSGDVLDIPFE
jgi:hypothetical protein